MSIWDLSGAQAVALAVRIPDNVDYAPDGKAMGSLAARVRAEREAAEFGAGGKVLSDKEITAHAGESDGEIEVVEV